MTGGSATATKKTSKGSSAPLNPSDLYLETLKASLDGDHGGSSNPPPTKRVKTEKTNAEPSSSSSATGDDLSAHREAYNLYHDMKNDQLKDVLRWNRQILMGTKSFLLVKVIDGHVHGRLARCGLCGGGRLKLQENGLTVVCGGTFDEDSQTKMDCSFTCKAVDAPRWKPWFSEEPSEAEKLEMDRLEAQVKGDETTTGNANDPTDSDPLQTALEEDASQLEWNLKSKQGLRDSTQALYQLLKNHQVAVPDEMAKVGALVAANRSLSAGSVALLALKEYGRSSTKQAQQVAKQAAVEAMVRCPANARLVAAFQELSQLYFKEGNRNAGTTYSKLVGVIRDFDFEVTEDNALGLGKGKNKVPGVGKASSEKMLEFVKTGTIEKLQEKRADAN